MIGASLIACGYRLKYLRHVFSSDAFNRRQQISNVVENVESGVLYYVGEEPRLVETGALYEDLWDDKKVRNAEDP